MVAKSWLALVVATTFVGVALYVSSGEIRFGSLTSARNAMESSGFYCISDRLDGTVEEGGFVVSRDQLSWEMVNCMRKVGEMNPHWQRMAWVTARGAHLGDLMSCPEGADVRVWGNVYIVGQSAVLDEIERTLREHRRN